MEVRPQYSTSDTIRESEHVMVVVPIDAQQDKAQHIDEEYRHQPRKCSEIGAVRHLQLQYHDRNKDCDYAVGEGAQSLSSHTIFRGASFRTNLYRLMYAGRMSQSTVVRAAEHRRP